MRIGENDFARLVSEASKGKISPKQAKAVQGFQQEVVKRELSKGNTIGLKNLGVHEIVEGKQGLKVKFRYYRTFSEEVERKLKSNEIQTRDSN